MSNKTKSKRVKMLLLAILLVPLFQACNNLHILPICSHPWLVVGFDEESIGTTIGEIDIQKNEKRIIQIGIEFFDQIAQEYRFYEMKQMYSTNKYPKNFYEKYGVYPMNVFIIELVSPYSHIDEFGEPYGNFRYAMEELLEDNNIFYVDQIRCSGQRCRDSLSNFKSIGGRK